MKIQRSEVKEAWFVMGIIFLLCLMLSVLSDPAKADPGNLVISAGVSATSSKPFNPVGEWDNKSNQYSVRYEGERFGLRWDGSKGGDDADNAYITADLLARPFKHVIVAGGLMYAKDRLRTIGKQLNFHAMAGLEFEKVFYDIGLGAYFDHDSNGHIHRLIGEDGVPNPPRNVVSLGFFFPFSP